MTRRFTALADVATSFGTLESPTVSMTVVWPEGSATTPSSVDKWSLACASLLSLSDFGVRKSNFQRLASLQGLKEASLAGCLFSLENFILYYCGVSVVIPDQFSPPVEGAGDIPPNRRTGSSSYYKGRGIDHRRLFIDYSGCCYVGDSLFMSVA